MTRTGKIARLPHLIREELNTRLEQNIPGITLVDWLNSLPEVRAIVDTLFEGNPVSPQNLSEWRQGGYAEWQTTNAFLDRLRTVSESCDKIEATCGSMADHAARLLAAQIALMLADPSDDEVMAKLKHLLPLIRGIALLRRGDHSAARLKLAQYKYEQSRGDSGTANVGKTSGMPPRILPGAQPSAIAPVPGVPQNQSDQIKPVFSEDENDPSTPSAPASAPPEIVTEGQVTISPTPVPAANSAPLAPVPGLELPPLHPNILPAGPAPAWRIPPLDSRAQVPEACLCE